MTTLAPFFVWFSLILAPLAGIGTFLTLQRRAPHALSPVAICCAALLFVVIAATLMSLSFSLMQANVSALCFAYAAYCFLAVSCWRLRPAFLKFATLTVAFIPILLSSALSLTPLVLVVFLLAADAFNPPQKSEKLRPGLVCTTTLWGWAASDEGYVVHLYRFWPRLPLLRREVGQISVDESNPSGGPPASCADVLRRYEDKGRH